MVRSSSGDTDIPVILLAMPFNLHIMIDNGTGKSRKYLDLRQCGLTDIQRSALLGMHAFSGNDYVSSMLRKGKQLCWKHIKDSERFLEVFSSLGTQMELNHHQLKELEKFVCVVFGEARLDSVNDERKKSSGKDLRAREKSQIYHFSHLAKAALRNIVDDPTILRTCGGMHIDQ